MTARRFANRSDVAYRDYLVNLGGCEYNVLGVRIHVGSDHTVEILGWDCIEREGRKWTEVVTPGALFREALREECLALAVDEIDALAREVREGVASDVADWKMEEMRR